MSCKHHDSFTPSRTATRPDLSALANLQTLYYEDFDAHADVNTVWDLSACKSLKAVSATQVRAKSYLVPPQCTLYLMQADYSDKPPSGWLSDKYSQLDLLKSPLLDTVRGVSWQLSIERDSLRPGEKMSLNTPIAESSRNLVHLFLWCYTIGTEHAPFVFGRGTEHLKSLCLQTFFRMHLSVESVPALQ